MSVNHKNLFKTNEFAKLCGVNKKTLIYYDNIGLFSPCFTDENGYRYYSHQQYDTFGVISALKELDMSLKEIKEFLNNRTPNNFILTLAERKKIINSKIEHLSSLSSMIDNISKLTRESKDLDFDSISIIQIDEEYLILSEKLASNEDYYILKMIRDQIEFCSSNGIDEGNPIGVIISKESLLKNEFTKLNYIFSKTTNKINNPESFIKPKGLYVIAYHKGDYNTTYKTYKKMMKFIKDNNLIIKGNSYEETILDYFSYSNPSEYITKISIEVDFK